MSVLEAYAETKEKNMKEMTVKEALDAGYEYCGEDVGEWQSLTSIEDLDEEDFKETDYYLFQKKPDHPSISAKDLKEMIAEQMESQWGDDTGDDTERVFEAVSKLDFEPFANMINDSVADISCYWLTDIKLKP